MSSQADKKFDSPAPRREFLKQGLVSIAGLAALGSLPAEAVAQAEPEQLSPMPSQPFKSQRILREETTGSAPYEQHYAELEMIGSNDVRLVQKTYVKRIDGPVTYDVTTQLVMDSYTKSTDPIPARTMIVTTSSTGQKGRIEGAYRFDTVTTTVASPSGITTSGPKEVKVNLIDSGAGLSLQERLTSSSKKGAKSE